MQNQINHQNILNKWQGHANIYSCRKDKIYLNTIEGRKKNMMNLINKFRWLHKWFSDSSLNSIENKSAEGDLNENQTPSGTVYSNNPSIVRNGVKLLDIPHQLQSIDEIVGQLKPTLPLFCIRPKTIESTAKYFISKFPGEVLYAVKCNPDPNILKLLWDAGIDNFDCASIKEIELIHTLLPSAKIHFMHPIKCKTAILQSYFNYDVRDYALDSVEELNKITEIIKNGDDLGLFVRIEVGQNTALYDLSCIYLLSTYYAM